MQRSAGQHSDEPTNRAQSVNIGQCGERGDSQVKSLPQGQRDKGGGVVAYGGGTDEQQLICFGFTRAAGTKGNSVM